MTLGNSSPAQSANASRSVSLGNAGRRIPNANQQQIAFPLFPAAGALNDDRLIRATISSTIRACTRSRDQIADAMSLLLDTRVTAKMLNSYSSEAMQPNRFPAAWVRAFCKATGDDALLRCCATAAGLVFIEEEEKALLELGREYLRQKRAAEKVKELESKLAGVEL